MSINIQNMIQNMIEDNVQSHLIKLASMSSEDLFEKIAMNIDNPYIFRNFLNSDTSILPWPYAYAAGLITSAEVDLLNSYSTDILNPDDNNPNEA